MNKALWSHFKHFGRLLGKIYPFLTPSKTDGRVPSQQGAPTTSNLTYWEVSQQTKVQTLLASLVVDIGQNSALLGGVKGGGGRWGFSQIAHTSYSRHQRTKSLQTPWIVYFPATISPFKDILFFPNLPASEKLPEEQIYWGKDPLGAPEIYQLYTAYMFFLALALTWDQALFSYENRYNWAWSQVTLAFKIDEKAFNYSHYPSILLSFLGKNEHFGGKNGAF